MIPQLMIPVERAVRPVVASHRRKMQMREELYSLMADRYQQQRDAGLSESDAVANALQSFGDHHALTQELQQTVPYRERLVSRWNMVLAPRQIPASLGNCISIGARLSALLVIFFLGCECMLWMMHHKNAFLVPQCLLGIAFVFGLGSTAATWLGSCSIVAKRQGQTLRIAFHCALFAMWIASLFGLLYFVSDVNFLIQSGWWRLVLAAVVTIPVYLAVVWEVDKELDQSDPWNSLELAD